MSPEKLFAEHLSTNYFGKLDTFELHDSEQQPGFHTLLPSEIGRSPGMYNSPLAHDLDLVGLWPAPFNLSAASAAGRLNRHGAAAPCQKVWGWASAARQGGASAHGKPAPPWALAAPLRDPTAFGQRPRP